MKKSFITVSPDSGQNDNILNIVCDKTTLSTNRKEVLNVATLDPTICICDCIITP